jgi:hypothetical protein
VTRLARDRADRAREAGSRGARPTRRLVVRVAAGDRRCQIEREPAKKELIRRRSWPARRHAQTAIFALDDRPAGGDLW